MEQPCGSQQERNEQPRVGGGDDCSARWATCEPCRGSHRGAVRRWRRIWRRCWRWCWCCGRGWWRRRRRSQGCRGFTARRLCLRVNIGVEAQPVAGGRKGSIQPTVPRLAAMRASRTGEASTHASQARNMVEVMALRPRGTCAPPGGMRKNRVEACHAHRGSRGLVITAQDHSGGADLGCR